MGVFQDITGKKYNMLTVIEKIDNNPKGVIMWKCLCDCGNETIVRGGNLKSGMVKSCGCLRHKSKTVTHGKSKTKLYHIWNGMKNRCYNKNSKSYKNYGGRGISICSDWLSFESFSKWANENGYSDGLTIERIDNDGNYCPDNCTWITKGEQAQNRRMCRKITYNGKTQTLMQWCHELNVDYSLVHNRINKLNWDFEKAIFTPCNVEKRNKKSRKMGD